MPFPDFEAEFEAESESEAAEAASRAPKRPSSQPSFRPRPPPSATPQYVTQTQLEAALTRSDGKIKTVADGVSQINTRLSSLSAAAKKEADSRKKSVDVQSKDLNQKLQMLALLPLLVTAPVSHGVTVSVPAGAFGTGSPATATTLNIVDSSGTQVKSVSKPDKSTLDALLPLLLISGFGTSGPGGLSLGGDGGDMGGMMMLALVLALGNK